MTIFSQLLKKPSVIGEHFLLPHEWLEGAKTVIYFPSFQRSRQNKQQPGEHLAIGWLAPWKDRRAGFSEEYVPETTG